MRACRNAWHNVWRWAVTVPNVLAFPRIDYLLVLSFRLWLSRAWLEALGVGMRARSGEPVVRRSFAQATELM